MSDQALMSYAERELKYQARKAIAGKIREQCTDSDPMVAGITVALGTVVAMAVFCAMLSRNGRGKAR